MYASKPLGEKAKISDSLMRFTLKNYGVYPSALGVYNAWVTSDAIDQKLPMHIPEYIKYALGQAEAFFQSTRTELIMCKEIEDCFKK